MDRVLNQRRSLLTASVGLAIALHFVVLELLLPLMPAMVQFPDFWKFLLSGGLLYSVIVFAPLWLYDRLLWRILNPQLDLNGQWEVTLQDVWPTNADHISPAGLAAMKPHEDLLRDAAGIATIRQNPFRALVQEATAFSGDSPWTGEIVDVALPGRLSVVFEATGKNGVFSGRDLLTVSKRNWRGRPIELVGDAVHVIKHLDIALKGTIRYRRVTRQSSSRFSSPGLAVLAVDGDRSIRPQPIGVGGTEEAMVADKELYRVAFDTRNLEITLFWQRCNYFLVLNSALALGFFNIRVFRYSLLLALVGFITSILWFRVSLGSKFWQSRWEYRLAEIEKQVAPSAKLFAADLVTIRMEVEESLKSGQHGWFQRQLDLLVLRKPSVSLMMMILSLVFVGAWAFVIILLLSGSTSDNLAI